MQKKKNIMLKTKQNKIAEYKCVYKSEIQNECTRAHAQHLPTTITLTEQKFNFVV